MSDGTKVLAIYGTAYGQTERIVRRIADVLTARGLDVSMHKGDALPAGLALDAFDGFLVGASIIGGRHQRYMEDFVRRHVARLNAVPSAFVSVSGAAASPLPDKRAQAGKYVEEFLQATGWKPGKRATIAGAIVYTRYGFFLRWIMKRIVRRGGGPTDTTRDHEQTDWETVERFAEDWAQALKKPAVLAGVAP